MTLNTKNIIQLNTPELYRCKILQKRVQDKYAKTSLNLLTRKYNYPAIFPNSKINNQKTVRSWENNSLIDQ